MTCRRDLLDYFSRKTRRATNENNQENIRDYRLRVIHRYDRVAFVSNSLLLQNKNGVELGQRFEHESVKLPS